MNNTFKSIENVSLVDRVESNLVLLLQQQKLKVGDSIPTELELTEMLGVSRTVVREALMRLRLMGLIESKKKKGSVITIRLVLEIGMADLLFHRVSKEDIKILHEIVDDEPPSTQQHLFVAEHEITFHGKLYEITGNETLKKFQKLLLPVFDYVHKSGLLKKQDLPKMFVSHKELVNILESGTPEQFRNGMRSHLENHFKRLFDLT